MPELILASQSPRRRQLMEQAGYRFEVLVTDVDETNPEDMPATEIAEFLARKKADAVSLPQDTVVIAADTLVLLGEEILGKPDGVAGARAMLRQLSGKTHVVATGVCLRDLERRDSFTVLTEVTFRPLSDAQIEYYVTQFPPLDKSGSYAIHEWIGLIAIERINGDYYSVMGLPIGEVVQRLARDFGVALAG
jgi:septum formation protein